MHIRLFICVLSLCTTHMDSVEQEKWEKILRNNKKIQVQPTLQVS